jgi:ABC-2 type transport system permease protein
MNIYAVRAIYLFELKRTWRTIIQSIATPVISTSLYFIVFGSAIGSHMSAIDGVAYGAFIVPGLVMLTLLTESIANASIGIYLPRFTGAIYELLSAPVSVFEVLLGYVGAAATKSIFLGLTILLTANLFVSFDVLHPVWMIALLALVSVSFSLFGFILGVWADNFEKLQIVPLMIVSPLTFLGGAFYSIDMLPNGWRTVARCNPIVYLVNGFRWTFYGAADVSILTSLAVMGGFFLGCVAVIVWIFQTGYRLRS